MRSRPHTFIPLPQNKMVLPQGVLPPPPPSNSPVNAAAATPAVLAPLGAGLNCGQMGHFAQDCNTRDQARKHPARSREIHHGRRRRMHRGELLQGPLFRQLWPSISCGLENPVSDDFAYNRWAEIEAAGAAAPTVPLEDDRVLMLHPAEPHAFYTPSP